MRKGTFKRGEKNRGILGEDGESEGRGVVRQKECLLRDLPDICKVSKTPLDFYETKWKVANSWSSLLGNKAAHVCSV